jgi:hypothetical protein
MHWTKYRRWKNRKIHNKIHKKWENLHAIELRAKSGGFFIALFSTNAIVATKHSFDQVYVIIFFIATALEFFHYKKIE